MIPSALTMCNLLLGFAAIAMSDLTPFYAMVCIYLAAVFDGIDGLAARAFNAITPFGKQLDSLADMVTFGVAPAVLIYQHLLPPGYSSLIIVAIIPLFAAIRLARFNNDTSQSTSFRGLPTPAAALFLAPLPYIDLEYAFRLYNEPLLIAAVVVAALLMLMPIRMFSFKGLKDTGPNRVFPILLILGSIGLLIPFQWMAMPLIIILYLLLSLLYNVWNTPAHQREQES